MYIISSACQQKHRSRALLEVVHGRSQSRYSRSRLQKYEFEVFLHTDSHILVFSSVLTLSIHNKQITSTGKERGDLELKDYFVLQKPQDQANRLPPPRTLIMDFTLTLNVTFFTLGFRPFLFSCK